MVILSVIIFLVGQYLSQCRVEQRDHKRVEDNLKDDILLFDDGGVSMYLNYL